MDLLVDYKIDCRPCILGLSTMTKKIDNPDSWNGMLGIVLPLVTSVGLAMVAVILRYLRELHFT